MTHLASAVLSTTAVTTAAAAAPAFAVQDAVFETANAAQWYPLELAGLLGATVGIYLFLNKVVKLI